MFVCTSQYLSPNLSQSGLSISVRARGRIAGSVAAAAHLDVVRVLSGAHRGRHHAVLEQSADVRLHLPEHTALVQVMVLRVCKRSHIITLSCQR